MPRRRQHDRHPLGGYCRDGVTACAAFSDAVSSCAGDASVVLDALAVKNGYPGHLLLLLVFFANARNRAPLRFTSGCCRQPRTGRSLTVSGPTVGGEREIVMAGAITNGARTRTRSNLVYGIQPSLCAWADRNGRICRAADRADPYPRLP
jgi:hypothetical protein